MVDVKSAYEVWLEKENTMGTHLIDFEFQSDKYPTTPRGKVPLSTKDKTAQDLLWTYAQRHRYVDKEFADDLEAALLAKGYVHEAPKFGMSFDEYQEVSFAKRKRTLSETECAAMLALGVAGEAGEVADFMKKSLYHRDDAHNLDLDQEFKNKIMKELGDVLWYLASLAALYDIKLSNVAQANVDKLEKRYPKGFTAAAAVARADGEKNDQDVDHDPVMEKVADLKEALISRADEFTAAAQKCVFPEMRSAYKSKADALRDFAGTLT